MLYQFEKKEDQYVGYCPVNKIIEKSKMVLNQGLSEKSVSTVFDHLGIPIGLVLFQERREPEEKTEEIFHSEIPDDLFEHLFQQVAISKSKNQTRKKK